MLPQKLFDDTKVTPSGSPSLDNSTFEVIFKESFSSLCVYCQFKFGFDLDQAKEVVHIAFIKLWENRETISHDLSIKSYLYKIITNVSYDLFRHDKVKQKHENHVFQNLPLGYNKNEYNKIEFKELTNNIDRAVSELPFQMRQVFELSRYEGLKYSEISSRLSISVKTVETQMSRALAKLRCKLSHYLPLYLLVTVVFF